MKNFVLSIRVFCLIFMTAPFAGAQQTEFIPQALHESLGEVIDSDENSRYNIFGNIEGLTAVRIYKVKFDKFQIHLLRNTEESAQLHIINLSTTKFSQLLSRVAERIDSMTKGGEQNYPVYPIEEAKWIERSPNKKLVLRDGSQLFVTLEQSKQDTLIVKTIGGLKINVPDTHVARITELPGEVKKGEYIRSDPNASRLFFAPTGRGLGRGNGYFADYFVFFPTLAVGLSDFFSLGGGVSLLPGADSQLLYFAPKLTVQASPEVSFGTGLLYLAIPDEEDDVNLGYAVTTIGSDRSGLTFGAGLPLTSDSDNNLMLLIGGEAQISGSSKLITENWIFTGSDEVTVIFSGGIRFFGEKLAVDLALITTEEAFDGGGFPFLPWVDFSVSFGN